MIEAKENVHPFVSCGKQLVCVFIVMFNSLPSNLVFISASLRSLSAVGGTDTKIFWAASDT
jgi:hypothetical protein